MKTFTVIGYYEDNGQSHASTVQARDAAEAFARVADMAPTYGGDLILVAAVGDGHEVFSPCPDATEQDTCAARDYPAEYEGWEARARELTAEEKYWVDRSGEDDPQACAYDNGLPASAVRKYLAN